MILLKPVYEQALREALFALGSGGQLGRQVKPLGIDQCTDII